MTEAFSLLLALEQIGLIYKFEMLPPYTEPQYKPMDSSNWTPTEVRGYNGGQIWIARRFG